MFTAEEKKIGRRNFLKAAAALPAVGAFAALHKDIGKRVSCGIIGTGGEGRVLLENAPVDMLDVRCMCDIRPDSIEHGRKVIERRWKRPLDEADVITDDYTKMLERKDIEAVIIATPLWLHAPMTIAALNAGKHVLCEKTMAYTIEEAARMKQAAEKNGKNLQLGHQRFYSPIYQQAYDMVKEGLLGDVYHVRALWHRNNNWRRGVGGDWEAKWGDIARQYGYKDIEHLVNWRLYQKHSQGLMTELATHQLAITNWLEGDIPESVHCSGGIYRYDDGREIEDHIYAIWKYPSNMTVTWSSIMSNKLDHYYEQIMGTKGTLYLSGEVDMMYFSEDKGKQEIDLKPTNVASQQAGEGDAVMEASKSRAADAGAGMAMGTAKGGGLSVFDAYTFELQGFAQTIRNGMPNLCDPQMGLDAAIAGLKAREAMLKNERLDVKQPPMA